MTHACDLTGAGTRTHHICTPKRRRRRYETLRAMSKKASPRSARDTPPGVTQIKVRKIRQPGHRQGVGALRRRELSWRRFTFLLASLSALRLPFASHLFRLRLPSYFKVTYIYIYTTIYSLSRRSPRGEDGSWKRRGCPASWRRKFFSSWRRGSD